METIENKKYKIKYYMEDGICILESLVVPLELRGLGVAKKAMERFLKKMQNKKIELHAYGQDAETDTNRLVSFYEKFGFSVECGDSTIGYEMRNY